MTDDDFYSWVPGDREWREQQAAKEAAWGARHAEAAEQARARANEMRAERLGYDPRDAKAIVFGHYGQVCACCGTTKRLTIDHVNGDGDAHRTALFGSATGGGMKFYRWLIEHGFPNDPPLQTLCGGCNSSKRDGPRCRLNHRHKLRISRTEVRIPVKLGKARFGGVTPGQDGYPVTTPVKYVSRKTWHNATLSSLISVQKEPLTWGYTKPGSTYPMQG